MEYNHLPVLYDEVLNGLNIKKDGVYFDGTLGGGGHALGILQRLENGKLIATDKDDDAINFAMKKLDKHKDKLTVIKDDYKNIIRHLDKLNIDSLDGVILDLGISSYQIDTPERGFSYINDAPLDMRMDRGQAVSAYEVINEYEEKRLADIIYQYGEERYSRRIAKKILEIRKIKPISSTKELADIVEKCFPPKDRYRFGNPAKRTFQAIRIEVNDELRGLKEFINDIALYLKKGGRMCVISFHSLEDRIVKHCFKELEKDCICDKNLPVCVCDKRREVKILTKKPISGKKEGNINKRANSAKLRIIERV